MRGPGSAAVMGQWQALIGSISRRNEQVGYISVFILWQLILYIEMQNSIVLF